MPANILRKSPKPLLPNWKYEADTYRQTYFYCLSVFPLHPVFSGPTFSVSMLCCCKPNSNPQAQTKPYNRRRKQDGVFDRRGTWPQNSAAVIGGGRSPGTSPTRQGQYQEEDGKMDKMARGFNTPVESQVNQDTQSREEDSHELSRKNSLTGSIKELTKKALCIGSSAISPPKLSSYLGSWRLGQSSRRVEMSESPRSHYHDMPDGLDGIAPPRSRQDYGGPPQPHRMDCYPFPPSPTRTALPQGPDQNLTPQSSIYGPTTQQPHLVQNGGYYHTGLNVNYNATNSNHGPYVSTQEVPPTYRPLFPRPANSMESGGMWCQPNPNTQNESRDTSAEKTNWFSSLGVIGKRRRRRRLPTSEGYSEPPTDPSTFTPTPGPDGRFPCPSCAKTYTLQKHLNRHLRRHTGDRPYVCPECGDCFARCDTLKKHYIKCAQKRGKLVYPRHHLKASAL
ncbi:hypothetical protein BKA65DRAFT_541659 [Rhexocercosporidium sp. MPI-PUGE-AT-0058]|nr:hypothetical protein BKA65DRAFT_541659 [Rhexocercosporidium sp. MPI-PUGE-AT-0058]